MTPSTKPVTRETSAYVRTKSIIFAWLPKLKSIPARLLAFCTSRRVLPTATAPAWDHRHQPQPCFPWRRTTAQIDAEPDDVGLGQWLAASNSAMPVLPQAEPPGGRSASQSHRSSSSSLIHLVGAQGVGKTTLAMHIIAGLEKQGKSAYSLVEGGHQCDERFAHAADFEALRCTPIRQPYTKQAVQFDFLIVEHQERPRSRDIAPGEWVITVERAK